MVTFSREAKRILQIMLEKEVANTKYAPISLVTSKKGFDHRSAFIYHDWGSFRVLNL